MPKMTRAYRVFNVFNILIMLLVVVVTLFPVLNIAAKSFSSSEALAKNDVTIYPKDFSTHTYELVMADKNFWTSYGNTVIYTASYTAISLLLTGLFAYPLASPRLKGKTLLVTFVIITMFFNGGIIPNYLLVRGLGMRNTIWAIIIPGCISTFNLLVMRTFFQGIPRELEEAAAVDGMSTYGILLKIVVPLSMPIIATISLFYSVGMWNSWFSAFMYVDHARMYPVTIYLRNIITGASIQVGANADALGEIAANIKAVTIVLTAIPILCVYPFVQRYFVKGVMIGSVKG